jgi:phosphatidylinositol 4-kinase
MATVSLMSKSGLPCFGHGHPLENLRKRFHLEMSDSQAAAFMRSTVHDAYDKVRAWRCLCKASLLSSL